MPQNHTSASDDRERPANRLKDETSPYLLQHAHNPVDWYPWGPEALERAKAEDRPIFLSIGYSACHWCHVMERESFENPDIAGLMNEHFVNIKVDREERPDLDQIYMSAVQAMTGHGGWPMSVFLTPSLQPFYGGTYYPPIDSRGMAGFPRVLLSVSRAWKERRSEILQFSAEMGEHLRALGPNAGAGSGGDLGVEMLDRAAASLMKSLDPVHGGFGRAPKFPHPMDLRVLLRHHSRTGDPQALNAVHLTLDRMARGGIYDHLGGGFARYSTDDRWLVPHFEKMLYDNALLAMAYLEAYQVTADPAFTRVAREVADYVLGRMTGEDGGFYSTEDADSEGEEGKYYVWSRAELDEVLGVEEAKTFASVYEVSVPGNWEGKNILNLPRPLDQAAKLLKRSEPELAAELDKSRARLLAVRDRRIPPGKDTKVLVSWNGLMIAALAVAGRTLREPRYLEAAARASGLILDRMRGEGGRLLHTYKEGQAKLNGYLDDYANLIDGLTRLYEATGEPRWVESALELAGIMIDEFAHPERGGFYYTGKSHEPLIARQMDLFDDATPSGNGMAATALLRLVALADRDDLRRAGLGALEAARGVIEQAPAAAGQSLIALDLYLAPAQEIAVISGVEESEFRQVLEAIFGQFLPHAVIAPASPEQGRRLSDRVPLLADRPARDGRTTSYICVGQACLEPAIGVECVSAALRRPAPVPVSGK